MSRGGTNRENSSWVGYRVCKLKLGPGPVRFTGGGLANFITVYISV